MEQTAIHEDYNPDVFALMPPGMKRVVEVGSSSGALAKAYREANPDCEYIGIEIVPAFAQASQRYCSRVICGSVEHLDDAAFDALLPADCWVFGDSLEHLYDPWALLARIRKRAHSQTVIVACVPNAQHWSVQIRLNSGLFRYEPAGLMDRTHIRWFTRITLTEMLAGAGFRMTDLVPRYFPEPQPKKIIKALKELAKAAGVDPNLAVEDAIPAQWVVVAVPA